MRKFAQFAMRPRFRRWKPSWSRMPPTGTEWQYEPKWDGFRCLAFRDGAEVYLQSKSGQPLARYFPDLVASLTALSAKRFVVDGEIVIPIDGRLSFDDLLMRDSSGRKPSAQTRGRTSGNVRCVRFAGR